MSEPILHPFRRGAVTIAVSLPFALDARWDENDVLTSATSRTQPPEAFSRNAWGYLISFLRGSAPRGIFAEVFGAPIDQADLPQSLAVPPQQIAVWLPNNVSLHGPLNVALRLDTGAYLVLAAGGGWLIEPACWLICSATAPCSANVQSRNLPSSRKTAPRKYGLRPRRNCRPAPAAPR